MIFKKISNRNQKYKPVLVIFIIFIAFHLVFDTILIFYIKYLQKVIHKKQIQESYFSITNYENCEPINSNYIHHKIKINDSIYPKSYPLHLNKSINFNCLNRNNKTKKILFWNNYYATNDYGFGLGKINPFINNNCPVTNCEVFNDKSRLNESDLVLVHVLDKFDEIPRYRPENQRWVLTIYESPVHSHNFSKYDNLFNFTCSYRRDSDFTRLDGTYQRFIWKENKSFDENRDYLENKTDFAAAVISNCRDNSQRLLYINELKKYIPVDVFGKCGIPCESKFMNSTRQECKYLISKKYKFYLGFENSICDDYISEKFFFTLTLDIIPVLLGGADYSYYVPKSGYINVFDFEGPKKLAEYLLHLANDHKAYNSYFKWKKHIHTHFPIQITYSPICDMCVYLHLEEHYGIKKKIIKNMGNFWNKYLNCKKAFFDSDKKFFFRNFKDQE